MKRPIFIATIAFINGIIIGVYLKKSIPFLIIFLFIILMIYIIRFINNKMQKENNVSILNINIILFYCFILCFSSVYTYYTDLKYENKYKNFDKDNVEIIGTIISNIEESEYKYSYEIKIYSINGDKKYKGDKLIVNVKKSNYKKELKYGNKIIFSGTYEEPSCSRNYKGFNYKQYLKTKQIYGILTQNNSDVKILKVKNISYYEILNNSIVEKLKQNFLMILPNETANLEIGILLGYSDNISENITQSFKDSNLMHMLAVSGENTIYVILAMQIIFNKKIIGNKKQKVVTIIVIIIFMKITGETLSVIRAGVTCIIYMIASLVYRKADVKNTIAIAAMITIINNPFNIFNVGMQLSYAGTISIILYYNLLENIIKTKNRIIKYLLESIFLTLSANIFIIPIMIYNFNTISLTFVFSNLIAGPLVGLATILGLFAIVLSLIYLKLAIWPAKILNLLLKLIIGIADIFAKMPISKILLKTPNEYTIIIIYILEILPIYILKNKKLFFILKTKMLIIKKYRYKIISILIIIVIIGNTINLFIFQRILTIHFIDVGQGDSCLIITPLNKKILIDGGGSDLNGSFDVGENILLPYLLDRQIKQIDYIMISHFDSDHCQGLEAVIKNITVNNIIIAKQPIITEEYTKIINLCKKNKVNIISVKQNDYVHIDRFSYFKIFNPPEDFIKDGKDGINANAIVSKFNCKLDEVVYSILFTGDIESITENSLVSAYNDELKADILKVPHHGSKTSSTQKFLERVRPKIALIGVGSNNKFGHPNEDVIDRLKKLNIKIYRTDQNGEITIKISKNKKCNIFTEIK